MKIKGIVLSVIGTGQGFYLPIAYTENRVEGGLVLGQKYDLDIEEAED